MKYVVVAGDSELVVEVSHDGTAPRLVGETSPTTIRVIRPNLFSVLIGGRSHEVAIEVLRSEDQVEVLATVDGVTSRLTLEDERRRILHRLTTGPSAAGHNAVVTVAAPMPGRIVGVPVDVGATVDRGQTVIVLEAMKMESALSAPSTGTVTEILVGAGQAVQQRQVLLRIQPGPA